MMNCKGPVEDFQGALALRIEININSALSILLQVLSKRRGVVGICMYGNVFACGRLECPQLRECQKAERAWIMAVFSPLVGCVSLTKPFVSIFSLLTAYLATTCRT